MIYLLLGEKSCYGETHHMQTKLSPLSLLPNLQGLFHSS